MFAIANASRTSLRLLTNTTCPLHCKENSGNGSINLRQMSLDALSVKHKQDHAEISLLLQVIMEPVAARTVSYVLMWKLLLSDLSLWFSKKEKKHAHIKEMLSLAKVFSPFAPCHITATSFTGFYEDFYLMDQHKLRHNDAAGGNHSWPSKFATIKIWKWNVLTACLTWIIQNKYQSTELVKRVQCVCNLFSI